MNEIALVKSFLKLATPTGSHADSPQWSSILASLHPLQRQFVLDGDIGLAGRGGGKSYGQAVKFHRRSHSFPGKASVFVALSTDHARDILLPPLEALSEK